MAVPFGVFGVRLTAVKSLEIQIGQRFGRWLVVGPVVHRKFGEGRGANYPALYPCRCDCGTERHVRAFKLLSNSRSCGCERRENQTRISTVHGHNRPGHRTHLYSCWDGMHQRCRNENHESYGRYGGRGIGVCEAWRTFANYAAWAEGSGYSATKQIDRIDNDGDYTPENCRWVTEAENKRNTSQNRHVTAFGETKCITDWAADARCTISIGALYHRLYKLHMDSEAAITTPKGLRSSNSDFQKHRQLLRLRSESRPDCEL